MTYPDNSYLFSAKKPPVCRIPLRQHPDSRVRIPMLPGARCLNLSNSVAVGVYEVLRQWDFPALQNQGQLHEGSWPEEAL
ncbi:MAG: tRNA (cytidine(34)-2'-O)-methyltransferase [Acutalibacteraceae bacterium]